MSCVKFAYVMAVKCDVCGEVSEALRVADELGNVIVPGRSVSELGWMEILTLNAGQIHVCPKHFKQGGES